MLPFSCSLAVLHPAPPARGAGGCPWRLGMPGPCWLAAPRTSLRRAPHLAAHCGGDAYVPRPVPSLGEQLPASRLCRRNARREHGRPGRRPTAGADKAAFLLPRLPAERAACSRRGKQRRQQMPRGRAWFPPNSPRPPCPLHTGLGPSLPQDKSPFLLLAQADTSPGRTPSPAAAGSCRRGLTATALPGAPAPHCPQPPPAAAPLLPTKTHPRQSATCITRQQCGAGPWSRAVRAARAWPAGTHSPGAVPPHWRSLPRTRSADSARDAACEGQAHGAPQHGMVPRSTARPFLAAGRAAGAGRVATLGGAQHRSPCPTWLPARSPSANTLRARVPLPHPPSQ